MVSKADDVPVLVRDWYDVYAFVERDVQLICPDCDKISPELENVFAAVKWVEKHSKECPA